MMAAHGCGQRIGFGRFLTTAALVALGLGGVPGGARACHLRHRSTATTAAEAATPDRGSTVHSQQILTPTSLVPQAPPLTPTTAPTITTTAAAAATPAMAPPSAILTPTPVSNPPAAEQVVPSAPPAVAAWHDAGPPACTCSCPPMPTNVPVATPAPQGLNPPAALTPPAASSITPNTPEPATIVSALAMIGAAAAHRRRARRVG